VQTPTAPSRIAASDNATDITGRTIQITESKRAGTRQPGSSDPGSGRSLPMITMSARAAIPNPSSTARAASFGTPGTPSSERPHQGMVSEKKIAVPTATATRRGDRPPARMAPMTTTTTR
jgi:hypothetical protein